MTPEYFNEKVLLKTFDNCIKLSETKGKEYTQGGEDRLKNFKTTGLDLEISPLKVCYIFMKKHWDSITTYAKTEQSYSTESILGRLDDLILYAVLMKANIIEGFIKKDEGLSVNDYYQPNSTTEEDEGFDPPNAQSLNDYLAPTEEDQFINKFENGPTGLIR